MNIDGSYGEGGGQILRTAVALSAVTGEPLKIRNIRRERPKPGLAAQHVNAVKSMGYLCRANVQGCALGSTELNFTPGNIQGGVYTIDIGTAGSIPLLLQCLMPAAMHAPSDIKITIIGGTDIMWSPSIDYLRFVTLGALSKMGYLCDIRITRRGYYPRGGGCVEALISPSVLTAQSFDKNECTAVEGISHSSNLPPHVVERQAASAEQVLKKEGYDTNISLETNNYPSTGSGLTLWCGTIGGLALGKPGLKAEKVGKNAALVILPELKSGAGVDIYLADQLIPYLGLAGGGSFTSRKISLHAKTNMWVTEQFLNVKFKIEEQKSGLFRVSV